MAELTVHLTPRASSSRLILKDGVLRAYVTAPPVDGEANSAIIELLAKWLGQPPSSIELKSGHKGRSKVFRIPNLTEDAIQKKIETLTHSS